jgi:hypothetical protein
MDIIEEHIEAEEELTAEQAPAAEQVPPQHFAAGLIETFIQACFSQYQLFMAL